MTSHHDHHQEDVDATRVAVLTVSDTRTLDDDGSGDAAAAALKQAGHDVVRRGLVPDDVDAIRGWVREACQEEVDVVLVTGGTGLAPKDVTPEAVDPLLKRRVPGFGEAFRRLSFEDVGPVGLLSRADAGITAQGVVVFLMPGSTKAVTLAVEALILPLVGHLVSLTRRRGQPR